MCETGMPRLWQARNDLSHSLSLTVTVRYPTCVLIQLLLGGQNIKLVIFLNWVKYSSQKFTSVRLIRVMLVFLCQNIFSKLYRSPIMRRFGCALSYWRKLDEASGYTEPSETQASMLMMCYFSSRKCVVRKPLVKKCCKTAKLDFQGCEMSPLSTVYDYTCLDFAEKPWQ